MAKPKLRQKALELRKEGKSYSQIKKELGVSKSTLSYWLRDYPLSTEQIRLLRDVSEVRIEKFRETMRKKKEARLSKFYIEEKRRLLPFNKRELLLVGLFLYWGEGVKGLKTTLGLNNTDPRVVKFYCYWLTKALDIPKEKIKANLHLYDDMEIEKEINFWSKELGILRSQFNKPYIKNSKREGVVHKGIGHGTCGLYVNDVRLKERIILGITALADFYYMQSM